VITVRVCLVLCASERGLRTPHTGVVNVDATDEEAEDHARDPEEGRKIEQPGFERRKSGQHE
jgi:hypothetical protein